MVTPIKLAPAKFCLACGTQLERKRFGKRLEDFSVFLRRQYCDQRCMGDGFEGVIKVMNDKNSRRQSAKARKTACERCGRVAHHVHHVDFNPQNNDPANLESLCASCHKIEHLPSARSANPLSVDL